jgi:hypothetical protein
MAKRGMDPAVKPQNDMDYRIKKIRWSYDSLRAFFVDGTTVIIVSGNSKSTMQDENITLFLRCTEILRFAQNDTDTKKCHPESNARRNLQHVVNLEALKASISNLPLT